MGRTIGVKLVEGPESHAVTLFSKPGKV